MFDQNIQIVLSLLESPSLWNLCIKVYLALCFCDTALGILRMGLLSASAKTLGKGHYGFTALEMYVLRIFDEFHYLILFCLELS